MSDVDRTFVYLTVQAGAFGDLANIAKKVTSGFSSPSEGVFPEGKATSSAKNDSRSFFGV